MASSNRRRNDLRTQAIVLRRTKYGETDRILNLLTPEGRKSCIARGVRKEKSKLAGGIEIFTVSDVVIHESEKTDLGIISDLDSFELGSKIIKIANHQSEHVDSPELFYLVEQCFWALHQNFNKDLIESFFLLNSMRIAGEELNLHRDSDGQKLSAELTYAWDSYESVLKSDLNGQIAADHIKLMRLMLTSPLKTVLKVQSAQKFMPEILYLAKTFAKTA